MKKWKKGLIIAITVFCLMLLIIGFVISNYFYNLALNPDSDKSVVTGANMNKIDMGNEVREAEIDANNTLSDIDWFEQTKKADIYVESYDSLKLHAYSIENPESENWVVICHGYSSSAEYMSISARWFYEHGYNVLLPNARGHGLSEGDYIGMGWDDRLDIIDWMKKINETHDAANIILYGVSMGGATVMMVSGEELPSNVVAIVEDCGYSSVFDEFAYQLKGIFGLPPFPLLYMADIVTNIRAGYSFDEASAVKQVEKSITPIMFIHGDADTFVPSNMVYEVYEAANVEKELLIVKGAGHGAASSIGGETYWKEVEQFITKYLE